MGLNVSQWERKECGVLCISPRKGSIQDSSRLEDDPLPLLSVLIDNMHVDEVQIDGGGTEAVVSGNMGTQVSAYSPKDLFPTALPARHQYGLQIAEGMVTFFESYERELEKYKYWTRTHFSQLS
jgi:hypothetical protein